MRVSGSGFKNEALEPIGKTIWSLGFRAEGLWPWVAGFRVQGLGFRAAFALPVKCQQCSG